MDTRQASISQSPALVDSAAVSPAAWKADEHCACADHQNGELEWQ